MDQEFIEYTKRRRKFNYKEKQDIITEYEKSGLSISEFSKLVDIKDRTLYDWIRDKDNIFSVNKNQLKLIKIGSGMKSKIPKEIELLILQWILDIRYFGFPITDNLIKARALFLLKEKNINIECKFSRGWIEKFKKRYNISLRKGCSKIVRSNDCSLNTIIFFTNEIKKKIMYGNFDAIINIDETAIYYDMPINFTLDVKGTKRVEIKSTGREKERISVILGIDLLNNISTAPFIILKGKTERCLKNIDKNEDYNISFQKNSWCTSNHFINFLSKYPNNNKILLIFDNFRSHKTEDVNVFIQKNYPLVETVVLPPNTTSILQPLDVGINKPFKSLIKEKYLLWLLDNFDKKIDITKIMKRERTNLLIKWIIESWRNIDKNAVEKSFKFCGYIDDSAIEPKWKKYYKL